MISSLFAGISGLSANSTAMTVIGDNIANVNTTAFKSDKFSFANVLSQSMGTSTTDGIGRGVQFNGVSPSWSQGSVENTSNPTDMAINGKGFFMVEDNTGSAFYTRAGEFTFDREGQLVNPDGLFVQGYGVSSVAADGTITLGSIENINVPAESTAPPQATTTFTLDINLDAGAAPGDTFASTQTVYDSLGNAIPLTLTFTKDPLNVNEWSAGVSVPPGTVTTLPGDINISNATLTFDGNGNLATVPGTDPSITLTNLLSGAADISGGNAISWDLFDSAGATNGDLTQYAAASTYNFNIQDGYAAGSLRGVSVDESGYVFGAYSNGQLTPLYQVVLADFPSYYGLSKLGHNLYAESPASGQAMPGVALSGSLGSISPSAIEMSNVDLAQEFVKMITTQRAFQANSRVITTSDEVLQELINLKR
jgi:flagellar hook protein FlgE